MFHIAFFFSHLLSSSWHFNSHVINVPQMFFDPQFLEATYTCMRIVPWELFFTMEWRGVIVYPQFPRVCFSLRPFNLHKTIPCFQPNETCDQVFHRGSNQKRRACFDPQFYIFSLTVRLIQLFFIALSFSGSLLGSLLRFFFFF